jgi:PTS system glucitol/sorbitol-specific IIA component
VTYYRTTIAEIGPEAGEMIAGGVLILFGEPLPEALAEMSIVHRPSQTLSGHAIAVGDIVSLAGTELRIDAVGDLATKNLDDLGHIVLYVNQPNQKLLPGAVLATGEVPDLKAGDVIEFRSSAS